MCVHLHVGMHKSMLICLEIQFEHKITGMNMQGNLNVCLSASEYLARGEIKVDCT